ncbi:hypothetical protein THASP1DRAFT_15983 [Thamnocephalis sphaerospora]|uniref:Methyltransferase type 11 domain-containing protein n=1 Tax=Thamnocephalis sphaerospora TaxID=78915 RepID=A0A4P9XQ95_9FUNG|nr:hypothetical protein THASP1DRAFT_15983 [Thamnocephalis sphaerospora]|eukprot:RKP08196.1 hypothetical protein THASP1DRAFT_15983 [Thamnocephalis sphaerospora]
MATAYPQASFLGVDVENGYPQSTMPVNCRFEYGDVLKGITYPNCSFDYVHIRFMSSSFPTSRWPEVLSEAYRLTVPGGWVEIVEWDARYRHTGKVGDRVNALARALFASCDVDPRMVTRLDGILTDVGFEQVDTRARDVPLGHWGGVIGEQSWRDTQALASEVIARSINLDLIAPDEVEDVMHAWEAEKESMHTNVRFYAFTARRPYSS